MIIYGKKGWILLRTLKHNGRMHGAFSYFISEIGYIQLGKSYFRDNIMLNNKKKSKTLDFTLLFSLALLLLLCIFSVHCCWLLVVPIISNPHESFWLLFLLLIYHVESILTETNSNRISSMSSDRLPLGVFKKIIELLNHS